MSDATGGPPSARRLHPRLRVPLAARYRLEPAADWQPGEVRNLSVGGAALRTPRRIRVGAVLTPLELRLPGEEEPIEVAAAVLRCDPEAAGEGGTYRSGLHFLNLEGAAAERVRLFVFRGLQQRRPAG